MDEKQWLVSQDPRSMVELATGRIACTGCVQPAQASERKLRLFACACIEIARGQQWGELKRYYRLAETGETPIGGCTAADQAIAWTAGHPEPPAPSQRVELARCLFGNPWRPQPCQCDPDVHASPCEWCHVLGGWLRWHDGTIRAMAQTIYDDRTFDLLPILADPLEEAGCDNKQILDHCRKGGLHARGCWVLDLILGKN